MAGTTSRAGSTDVDADRPAAADGFLPAVVIGVGLGMFTDGIVFHQVIQWHRLISSTSYVDDTVAGLEAADLADGLFHLAALVITVVGVALLWRAQERSTRRRPWGELVGGVLVGAGAFNIFDGVVNHLLLDLHHLHEETYEITSDLVYIAVSVGLVAIGLLLHRRRGTGWAEDQRRARASR